MRPYARMNNDPSTSDAHKHHAEWLPGAFLLAATGLALVLANSPARNVYETILNTKLTLEYGDKGIDKPLLLWINDGLMALFFLLIGLELKREFLFGHLRDRKAVLLPLLGAVGGMAFPAAIYAFVNWGDPVAIKGWAIPAATDIAFALAALGLFSGRLPSSLKIFLLSLAIFDDVGAIVIIALFYTDGLSPNMLFVGGGLLLILLVLNRAGVRSLVIYLFVGLVLWIAVLKSGVHATLAGVLLAFFIPAKPSRDDSSPAVTLEEALHGFCLFVVLPLFALANAGLSFAGENLVESILHPVPLGITLGLPLGNLIGVVTMTFIGIRLFGLRLPEGSTWPQIAGVACFCGIGFTMSLFIGSLAFEQGGPMYDFDERLGILLGSVVSATAGILILMLCRNPKNT